MLYYVVLFVYQGGDMSMRTEKISSGTVYRYTPSELTIKSLEIFCDYLLNVEHKTYEYVLNVYNNFESLM